MRAAVTVGSFDGLHVGHRAVLRALREEASRHGGPAVVVTFEPHPLQVLRPDAAPLRLAGPAERTLLLARSGVDRVHVLPFTHELADLDARSFVREVLIDELGCSALVVGQDHRLGRARAAGPRELQEVADREGLRLRVVAPVDVDGRPASSTRTRDAVAAGDLRLAHRLLARPYGVFAPAVRGAGRGAGLGVPTVNLALAERKLMPPQGIYACRAHVDGRTWPAAAHWGRRPTFADQTPVLEAHLIGFAGDLYGRWVELDLLERLRDVVTFASLDDLKAAMREDLLRAEAAAAAHAAAATRQTGEPAF